MKKWIVLILLVLIASGCSSDNTDTYTVTPMNVTEHEQQLLDALGDEVITSLDVNNLNQVNAKELNLWVDHYENGQLKESLHQFSSTFDDKDDDYRVFFINAPFQLDEKEYLNYKAALLSKNGFASFASEPIENDVKAHQAHAQLDKKMKVKVNETATIAFLIKTNKSGITVNHDHIFSSNDEFPEELAEYDHVYLVRMKVSN